MIPKVEKIKEIPNLELGEGPHWDVETQSLYFVDIFGKTIHKYVPSTKKHTQAFVGKPISLIIPVKNKPNQFVVTLEREVVIIEWDGISDSVTIVKEIGEVDEGTENRINDGKVDPTGRLWMGSMGPEKQIGHYTPGQGTLYSLEEDGTITGHVDKIGISNGLAWSKDQKKMYYVDSLKGSVDQFDFDMADGTIDNRTPIFTMSKNGITGFPDGITLDVDGNLWVAAFNGSSVMKIDPKKPETLLETVKIPAKQVTSVAWGGPKLDELYVTTASFTVDGVVMPPPDNGAMFKVTGLGTKGMPMENFVY